jgi:hypothetical protein
LVVLVDSGRGKKVRSRGGSAKRTTNSFMANAIP